MQKLQREKDLVDDPFYTGKGVILSNAVKKTEELVRRDSEPLELGEIPASTKSFSQITSKPKTFQFSKPTTNVELEEAVPFMYDSKSFYVDAASFTYALDSK